MKASVYSYYSPDEAVIDKIDSSAQAYSGFLFASKGDKVIKICSSAEFKSDNGDLVSTEQGVVHKVKISGMTCFRCVNAISAVVKELPVLAFSISLEENSGLFVLGEGVDINMIVSVINAMGSKFTASL